MFRFLMALLVAFSLQGCSQKIDDSRIVLTEEELAFIASSPEVIFALEENRPPYIYVSEGKAQGLAIEYLKIISKKTGLRFRGVPTETYRAGLEKLLLSKIDVVMAVRPTPGMMDSFGFTAPFAYQGGVFVFRSTTLPRSPLQVAVLDGGSVSPYLTERFPDMLIVHAQDDEEAMSLLNKGLVDGTVTDAATAFYLAEKGGVDIRAGHINFDYPFTIAFNRQSPILGSILNKAVASFSPKEK